MNYVISGRNPEQIFRFFEDICAIPHGSGNEKGVANYIEEFAKSRKLEYSRDAVHNVFIKKPATPGREGEAAVMLQAHTDMVCEKNADTVHDFLTDGLDLYVENGWLCANGTTLGADDGIGVAIMLALLDGAAESHPALECLFTVSEETGMDGVMNFDFSKVSARKLLNLDAAEVDTIIAGCAGGVRCRITFDLEKVENAASVLEIKICGLSGGHSGENIKDGRGNANKLMGRLLMQLGNISLVSINGGGKTNAIPRECIARVALEDIEGAKALVKRYEAEIKNELSSLDAGFEIKITELDGSFHAFSKEDTRRVVSLISCVANGVLKMSHKINGLVEYSRNLGVITTVDGKIELSFLARSGINAQLDDSCRELEALASLCGAGVAYDERYGGWDFAEKSPLRERYAAAYEHVVGVAPKIESIHAGLECGFIIDNIPDMDIISVGPNEVDIHSPDERLELASVELIWKVIEKTLAK